VYRRLKLDYKSSRRDGKRRDSPGGREARRDDFEDKYEDNRCEE
jgi:hypothetical protein